MHNHNITNSQKQTRNFARLLQFVLTLLLGLGITLGGMTLQTNPAYAASAGDIAIIGVRADDADGTGGNGNDDAFAWVPLVNLAAGAEIFFTDAGWTASNTFRNLEGAIKYTAPAGGLAAGTVMLLEFTTSGGNYTFTASGGGGTYSDADDANVGTSGVLPATPGDNLFIFEGSTAAPSFIWGWKNEGPFDADATSNDTTALPAGLTVGVNAMTVDATEISSDDSRYVGPTSGSAEALAAAIANPANWEVTSTLPFPSGGTDITNGTLGGGGFTVGSTNAAPTITSSNTASVAENQTSAIDVNATDDGDAEGNGLTYSLTGTTDDALFSIDANTGVVTFSSAPDFEAPADAGADNDYNIQVTVADSGALTAVQDITITVTDVAENTGPTITSNNTASVAENQTSAIDVNATDDGDAEGNGLTYSLTGTADDALFIIDANTGIVTFNSAPDFEAPADAGADNDYNIQVTVADSGALTAVQDITITVTDVAENTGPTITSSNTASVAENQTSAIDVNATDDSDAEGSGLTYSLTGTTDDALFSIDANTGVVTFNSAPDFEAPADANGDNDYNIQVTVTDSGALTAVQDITITVTDVAENTGPTITSSNTASVAENQTSAIDVNATDDSDAEGSGLTYSLTGTADDALFSIDANTGVVTFSSAPDFENPSDANGDNDYNIQVTVADSGALTAVQDIVITVTDVAENTGPTITSSNTASVAENQTSAIDVNATDDSDAEGSGLTYSLTGTTDDALFSIDANTGVVTFNSAPDFENPSDANGDNDYNIQVTVADSSALTAVQDITISVTDVIENTGPTITSNNTASVAENQTSAIDVNATDDSDAEGSGLTYSLTGTADDALFSIDANTGVVTFNSAPDFENPSDANGDNDYNIQVTVADSSALTALQDITISVTDVIENSGPTITSNNTASVAENQTSAIDVNATDDSDSEGNGLTYSLTGTADDALFSIDANTGVVTFNSAPDFENPSDANGDNDYNIQVTVADSSALTAMQDIVISVTDVVEAGPFATCGGYDVFETAPGVYGAPSFSGTLLVGSNGYDWLIGTNGPDLILGLGGPDDIWGKNGDDVICGGPGVDIILGMKGDDTLYGDDQTDWLIGGPDNDVLYGGDGWDDLEGNSGQDTLYGEDGYDILIGGSNNDELFGGEDSDALYGNRGDDDLNGGNDDDFCRGGPGNDTIANCEGTSAANDSSDDAELIDEDAARRSNDGADGEHTIVKRIQEVFLPVVSNK